MTSPSHASYQDVLEYCEQKLNEGDYLKMANFIKKLNDDQQEEPLRTVRQVRPLDVSVSWKTNKNKTYSLKIHKLVKTWNFFRSEAKIVITLLYTLNEQDCEELLDIVMIQLQRLYNIFGMKDIKRVVDGEEEEFKSMGRYKRHIYDLECQDAYDSDAEEEVDSGYTDLWAIKHLLTITENQTATGSEYNS